MKHKFCVLFCILIFVCLLAACGGSKEPYEPTGDGLGSVEVAPSATEPPDQSLTMIDYRQETLNPL